MITVPGLLAGPPDVMMRQWKRIYDVGKQILPPFSTVSGCVPFAYLAYAVPQHWIAYAMAAILPLLAVPYTTLVMQPTYNQLLAKASIAEKLKAGKGGTEAGLESVPELIQTWAYMNYGRSLFSISAAILGYSLMTS